MKTLFTGLLLAAAVAAPVGAAEINRIGNTPQANILTGVIVPAGADVRLVRGAVSDVLPRIREAAAGRDVWVVGGGDLAAQFLEADALDEIAVSVAPVTLGSGAPLLPRRVESSRLRLRSATAVGQFARLVYSVEASGQAEGQGDDAQQR